MSLILDALKRAEQDRKSKNAVPDISTLHQPADFVAAAPMVHKNGFLLAVILVLLCLLIGGSWFFMVNRPPQSAPRVENQPQVSIAKAIDAAAAPQTQGQSPVVATPQESAPLAQAEVPPVAQLYIADEPTEAVNPNVDELYSAVEEPMPSEPIVEPLQVQTAQPLDAGNLAEPRQVAVISRAADPSIQARARTYDGISDVIAFNDLPWNLKQQVPTISYSRHNYAANNISSVVINGQTGGQGNLISGDFVVEEILADGVVLRFKDKVFKLRALNGWVNM